MNNLAKRGERAANEGERNRTKAGVQPNWNQG